MEVSDYRKSHLSKEKGEAYAKAFTDKPYRRMVWELEKNIFNDILNKYYSNKEINHFDFACGTGRILHFLANRSNTSTGVDLSPSMLAVARKNNKTAEIIETDLTRNDVLGERKFNLITAFRFFPNAQSELRNEAMQVITKHITVNGYIVFNNHMHSGSLRYRLAKLIGRAKSDGMSSTEVNALIKGHNLETVSIYHLCVTPLSEGRMYVPRVILQPVEKLFARIPSFQNLAQNLIYVCKKRRPQEII
jgi:predicted TPR repeat methyltransferase